MAADRFRLPRTVLPSRYELTLEPDLDAATFAGTEAVAVEVVEPVTELLLNAQELEIDEAWLEPADGSGARLTATVVLEPEDERARLTLDGTAQPGAWVLHARFRGVLNDKLVGFYRSTFADEQGTEHTIAVTQFEATHARKAFPCWDEPEAKAVFAVTLVVPDSLTALSNASEVSSEPTSDGRRRVTFADTIKMSTYLVAFVIGPLGLTPPTDVRGAPLRIAFPPGNDHLTAFAIDSASFALAWFADYYGIAYPGDKCDLVAVPDFAFGAMENLGCITFREVLLLVDPERSTQPELQNVADVIHHELAHMWFGDLVTMKWWNGIWLNEAFATFMEMKCTDAFRPDWQRWVDFGLSRSAAFDTDSLASTRPIEFEVVSPQEAEGMFDVLTYEKGASVLRMLEQFLGEDPFRDGIRAYLAEHSYANTETTDLWDAIEASTGEPVRHIMDTWIFQGGYPVIEASVVGGTTLRVRQERFRYDAGASGPNDGDANDQEWAVPVLMRYGAGERVHEDRVLLDIREEDFDLRFEPEWLVLNAGGSGFYRVRYSAAQLAALGARLDQLTPLERYGLVDDTFASVLAGTTTVTEFLELARSFADDTDVSVWQRLAGALGAIDRIVDEPVRARYQGTVRALVSPALHRMGWTPAPGEDDRTRQLRATLFELAGTIGDDSDVQARARALHDSYVDDPESVDPPLAAAAITVIADSGGREEFDAFLQRFRKADNPQEEIRYLYSLAKFHDDDAFAELLELSLSEVRTQNAPFLLRLALSNRTHGDKAWSFVRRRWDEINERFPSSTIVRMAEGVRFLTDPALANEVEGFFAEHPVPQGERTMAQHLERLRVNVTFRRREAERLAAALA
ncbi:MAG: tricorn protease interacting factor [Acidimicrobiaceae bacterium]